MEYYLKISLYTKSNTMRKITLAILSLLMIACTPDRKREVRNDASEQEITREEVVKSEPETRTEEKEITLEDIKREKPFVTVEQMPAFKGGEAAMKKFIEDELKYPEAAKKAGIQGRVTIRFVVSSTGAIEDINVIRGIDPACDKEAIRVIKAMPAWEPGKQNGKAVAVYYTLPIVFRL